MAWRLSEYVINGELDNTTPGKVVGWIKFLGRKDKITLDLDGNFHRDIRGAKIKFVGDAIDELDDSQAKEYFKRLSDHQTGKVGDITVGRPPSDYVDFPYIEWYSKENGRVVIELEPEQVKIIGSPIPAIESDPISRQEQRENLTDFLKEATDSL
jgi:hypothetical protein